MKDLDSKSRSLDDAMNMLNPSYLAQVAGIGALVGAYTQLIGAMTKFAQQSIKTYSAFEKIQTELSTFYGDANKGKSTFEDLRKLSNSTTFGVDELASSFTQLANSGVAVDSINDKLVMLGNIAGGSKQKFAELTSIYSKIASTGKAGAMQLQQLALRGIPIRKVLQEMGVQGVATADDITEAFKRMTAEGGQFYNAMGNILDTIEGKEGEVQDFFKEFTVNFAEATGIADAYKTALGYVRDALEKLADIFRSIGGDNPLFKALFSGALIAVLGALTTIIGVTLVGAFIALNKQLAITATLKAIISPQTVAVGLLVAGLVGGAVALGVYANEQGKLGNDVDETTRKIREQEKAVAELRERQENGGYLNESERMQLNNVEVSKLMAQKAKIEKELEDAINWGADSDTESEIRERLSEVEKELAIYNKENEALEKMWQYHKGINELEEKHAKLENDTQLKYNDLYNSAKELFNNSKANKTKQTLELIQQMQTAMKTGRKIVDVTSVTSSGATYTQKVETAMTKDDYDVFRSAIQELSESIKKSFQPAEWAQVLGSLTGVEVTENNSSKIFGDYRKKTYGAGANIESFGMGNISTDFWRQYASNAVNIINGVISSGLFTKDSNTTKEMLASGIDALKKGAEQFGKGDIGSEEYRQNLQQSLNLIKTMNTLGADAEELYKLRQGYESEFLASLDEEYKKTQMTTHELQMQALIDSGMSEETADRTIKMGRRIDASKSVQQAKEARDNAVFGTDYLRANTQYAQAKLVLALTNLKNSTDKSTEGQKDLRETVQKEREEYNNALTKESAHNFVNNITSGTDVGDFINGAENGGLQGGLISMFFGALSRVVGGIQGLNMALSPFTAMLQELAPIFKTFCVAMMMLTPLMKGLGEAIMWVLDKLTLGMFSDLSEGYDEMMEEINGTAEAMRDLREDMQKLSDAIAEQAEYYLQKKKELNSMTYVEGVGFKSVNDMILTPQGQFSTHPDDYIIATKDPKSLGSGKTSVVMIEPTIINNASKDVSATISTKQEGDMTKMIVMISKKVASDVASGDNGWDSAMQQRENRIQGRRIAL